MSDGATDAQFSTVNNLEGGVEGHDEVAVLVLVEQTAQRLFVHLKNELTNIKQSEKAKIMYFIHEGLCAAHDTACEPAQCALF